MSYLLFHFICFTQEILGGGGSGCNYFLPTFLFFIYSKLDKNVNLAFKQMELIFVCFI